MQIKTTTTTCKLNVYNQQSTIKSSEHEVKYSQCWLIRQILWRTTLAWNLIGNAKTETLAHKNKDQEILENRHEISNKKRGKSWIRARNAVVFIRSLKSEKKQYFFCFINLKKKRWNVLKEKTRLLVLWLKIEKCWRRNRNEMVCVCCWLCRWMNEG